MSLLGTIGNLILGGIGLSDASKSQHTANQEAGAAANLYNQEASQGAMAQENIQSLLPILAALAGLSYGPRGVDGQGNPISGFTGQAAPTDYQNDPRYQNALNLFEQPLQAQVQNQIAGYNANSDEGIHQRGYSANVLHQQLAQALGQFNRQYMSDEYGRQQQNLGSIEQLLSGLSGGVGQGAQGLAGLSQNASANAAAQSQAAINALATIFAGSGSSAASTAKALPSVTGGAPSSPQTLPPPAATGNADTERGTPAQGYAGPTPQSTASLYPGLVDPFNPDPLGFNRLGYGNVFGGGSPYLPDVTRGGSHDPFSNPSALSVSTSAGVPDLTSFARSLSAPAFRARGSYLSSASRTSSGGF